MLQRSQLQETVIEFDPKALDTLREIVNRTKVGMLTTQGKDALVRSRLLHTLEADAEGRLWFFVAKSSPKIEEMRHEHRNVCLAYADTARQDYVSISGRGELVQDRARMKDLWSSWVKVWFPKGIDDPDLALLCVQIEQAEYWDSPGSAVRRFYALVKAHATGDKDAIGENRNYLPHSSRLRPERIAKAWRTGLYFLRNFADITAAEQFLRATTAAKKYCSLRREREACRAL